MTRIDISSPVHDWGKKNLVTLKDNKGTFDIMVCKRCGIEGKRRSLSFVQVPDTYSKDKIKNCTGVAATAGPAPKKIRIIRCDAVGDHFANLKPKSVHEVVDPPEGEDGIWVMGVGIPVKVLDYEFEAI